MALKPERRQEEWYQQMINAATGKYLPSITAQDAGKVMTVESDGSWGVENVPTELPAVETTDKDKYLHTDASTGAVEWANAPTELPSVTDVDEGKVLTVNNSGVWVAANPSAGGGEVLVVTATTVGQTSTLDKTWAEIAAADCVVIRYNDGLRDWRLTEVATGEGKGGVAVWAYMGGAIVNWESETESGYPTREA